MQDVLSFIYYVALRTFMGFDPTLEKTAELFAEANVLHPFREGNGRTQRIIFNEILRRIGHSVDYGLTDQHTMIEAMIHGYNANYEPVIKLFEKITL